MCLPSKQEIIHRCGDITLMYHGEETFSFSFFSLVFPGLVKEKEFD